MSLKQTVQDGLQSIGNLVHKYVPFIPADKVMHFLLSFALGLAVAFLGQFVPFSNMYAEVAVAMAPGVYKEYLDKRTPGNYWSAKDLWADLLGAVAGVALFGFVV